MLRPRPAFTVHHLNTYLRGGAARAAIGLHRSLLESGIASCMWHADRKMRDTAESVTGSRLVRWQGPELSQRWFATLMRQVRRRRLKWALRAALRGRDPCLEIFTTPSLARETKCSAEFIRCDVVNLHWVSQLIDYKSFFRSLPTNLPIVWTLHDMNPFTGGCHFSSGCDGFMSGCGNCPQLGCPGEVDISRQSYASKMPTATHQNLHIVAPSRWLANEARRSPILANAQTIRTIPYGLDIEAYSPQDRNEARQKLGLGPDVFVVGFGADDLSNRRKGIWELTEAMLKLQPSRRVVGLSFGGGELPPGLLAAMQVQQAGFVRGAEALSQLYSAMDMFVLPSLEDNLPQTGLEAMACGLPVVAFDIGGIPDFVRPNETGQLAATVEPAALAFQLGRLVGRKEECRRLGAEARKLIERKFNATRTAKAYTNLYREIMATSQALTPQPRRKAS